MLICLHGAKYKQSNAILIELHILVHLNLDQIGHALDTYECYFGGLKFSCTIDTQAPRKYQILNNKELENCLKGEKYESHYCYTE